MYFVYPHTPVDNDPILYGQKMTNLARRVDTSMTNGIGPLSKSPAKIVTKLENCFIHKCNSRDLANMASVMNKIVRICRPHVISGLCVSDGQIFVFIIASRNWFQVFAPFSYTKTK